MKKLMFIIFLIVGVFGFSKEERIKIKSESYCVGFISAISDEYDMDETDRYYFKKCVINGKEYYGFGPNNDPTTEEADIVGGAELEINFSSISERENVREKMGYGYGKIVRFKMGKTILQTILDGKGYWKVDVEQIEF